MKLAIVHKDKCSPGKCQNLCARLCPVNRKGEKCIVIENKASIDEQLCIGCGICQNRCPFRAIAIINLPDILAKKEIHRYGKNGFALYSLPLPRFGSILGLLGRNGIGKTTALQILGNKLRMNLGKEEAADSEIHNFFKGSEMLNYLKKLNGIEISYKPQMISQLAQDVKTAELLKRFAPLKEIKEIAEKLNISNVLDKKLDEISGGELQRVAIAATCLKKADLYVFDEPLNYLDISERINASHVIRELIGHEQSTNEKRRQHYHEHSKKKEEKTAIIVEHDLLLLDYVTDFINIVYGKPGCYGVTADIRTAKNAINSYLEGFLREENVRFRDKEISFKFGIQQLQSKIPIVQWPAFKKSFKGFRMNVDAGSLNLRSITAIAGRNATGKTTFVKCLAGLLKPDDENIDLKLKISYKPQYVFSQSDEAVAMIIKKEKIDKHIISILDLDELIVKSLKQLSGGELQRLAIAVCLAKEADVYLLDEPSAYLDVEERLQVSKAIKAKVIEKDRAALVVDHDLLFLSSLADSIIVFSGKPGMEGSASRTYDFAEGINYLLRDLDITLRRDEETGRPRINKKGSVLDRKQREEGSWFAESAD
jgi:ATP-binding cassette subfamily E protein 1